MMGADRVFDRGAAGFLPRVSVLMPVYNGGRFVQEAVSSILKQSFESFEFLIMNDGSTDGCLDFLAHCTDPRIRLVNFERNVGLVAVLNMGVELARGALIARMDADDISNPLRLELQVKAFDESPALALLGTWARYVDPSGRPFGRLTPPVSRGEIVREILVGNCFIHPTVMMRSDKVRELGGYSADAVHAEDYSLWLRFAERYEVSNLAEFLLDYRVHPGQVSQAKVVDQLSVARRLQVEARKRYLAAGLAIHRIDSAEPSLWESLRGLNRSVGSVYASWADLYRTMGDRQLSTKTAIAGLRFAPLSIKLLSIILAPLLEMQAVRTLLESRVARSLTKRLEWYETRLIRALRGLGSE